MGCGVSSPKQQLGSNTAAGAEQQGPAAGQTQHTGGTQREVCSSATAAAQQRQVVEDDIVNCAVSLEFLSAFSRCVPHGWTTEQVTQHLIKPLTRGGAPYGASCRYCELGAEEVMPVLPPPVLLPDLQGPVVLPPVREGQRGPPTYFVSHRWASSFQEMVQMLENALRDKRPDQVFVWVDIFAVDQHNFEGKLDDDLDRAVKTARRTLVVVGGDAGMVAGKPDTYGPFTRIWCLYEFFTTLKHKNPKALEFLLPPDKSLQEMRPAIEDMSVRRAQASEPHDRRRILKQIEAEYGLERFDRQLKKKLLLIAGDVVNRAVPFSFLLDFARCVPPGWTVREVVQNLIKPATAPAASSPQSYGCAYTDLAPEDMVPLELKSGPVLLPAVGECGSPTYYVKCRWSSLFQEVISSLERALGDSSPGEVFMWLDFFSVNQHDFSDDLQHLKSVISNTACGTLVVMDSRTTMQEGEPRTHGPLGKAWHLYEMHMTMMTKGAGALRFLLPPGLAMQQLQRGILSIDVSNTDATCPGDKRRILADIDQARFGLKGFNALLTLQLLLQPFSVGDLEGVPGLGAWAGAWDIAAVRTWIEERPLRNGALLFHGCPGEGTRMLLEAMHVTGNDTALRQALQLYSPHFIFLHFICKASDARRQDPLMVIKTLAYQLGTGHLDMGDLVMDAVAQAVEGGHLDDEAAAFETLLKRPIERSWAQQGYDAPAIFVCLGLDEAGSGLSAMLRFVQDKLASLPHVYLIVTSSTDCEHQVRATIGAMEWQSESLPINDMLRLDSLGPRLSERLRQCSGDQAEKVAGALLANAHNLAGHKLVYLDVVEQLLHRRLLQPGQPLPGTLHGAYQAVWDAALQEVRQVDVWAEGDAERAGAAAAAGARAGAGAASAGAAASATSPSWEASLQLLLDMLAVAREPLTNADLGALGLEGFRSLLPLWGFLFFEKEARGRTHVEVLDGSFLDWARGSRHVDPADRLLGDELAQKQTSVMLTLPSPWLTSPPNLHLGMGMGGTSAALSPFQPFWG